MKNKKIKENGYSPSIREIGSMLDGKCPATVFKMLERLRAKELITYKDKTNRTIRLIYTIE